jgi:hypothetical protein
LISRFRPLNDLWFLISDEADHPISALVLSPFEPSEERKSPWCNWDREESGHEVWSVPSAEHDTPGSEKKKYLSWLTSIVGRILGAGLEILRLIAWVSLAAHSQIRIAV